MNPKSTFGKLSVLQPVYIALLEMATAAISRLVSVFALQSNAL
ncbi:hypothetical protein Niako_3373 [Niastella koreensis GR20-10]|uniref:Uncharacterized protein n=1 Tax=Niastella koreensis (strain DSM 17620 / KACC 11465 / NBRC 106392 / GR20-10) TaxID=700598 RepID=G8TJE7_NIAKG|nr:hypothetical protein Niako_3373 [Niastella koreensis GR20-10]